METLSLDALKVNVSSPKKSRRPLSKTPVVIAPENRAADLARRVKVAAWMENLSGGFAAGQRHVDCGSPEKGWSGVCPDGHVKHNKFHCMLRNCRICGHMRSLQLEERLTPAIFKNLMENPNPDVTLKHIILGTNISLLDYVKVELTAGEPSLNETRLLALNLQMQIIRDAAADMLRDRFQKSGSKFFDKSVGFMIGVEFGEKLMLHLHVLAAMPFWEQKALSRTWQKYNGGRGNYVWIKEAASTLDGVKETVGYVTKYVTKPMSSEKVKHRESGSAVNAARVKAFRDRYGSEALEAALWFAFKGMRRFQTYMSFYGLEFDEPETLVCSTCGKALVWSPNYGGGGSFSLIHNTSDKLVGDGGLSPPKPYQLIMFGFRPDVDFMA